jgi:hypothetical protein
MRRQGGGPVPEPAPQPASEPATQAPAASTHWRAVKELMVVAIALPSMFLLGYGRIDGFVIGFTAFIVGLGAAAEFLPDIVDREAERQKLENEKPRPPRWYDGLALFWLLAIPFAPAFSWIMRSWIDIGVHNWSWVLQTSAFACVVLPLVSVLSMLRHVRRGNAVLALTILGVGTGFPVLTGAGSAYDVLMGPEWQSVTIAGMEDFSFRTGQGTNVRGEDVFVRLADGRELTRSERVSLQPGPARLLVLRGIGRVIDVEEGSNGQFPAALDPLAESN